MLRALRTGALGMHAQQQGVDNIANNLANANTTGYKRSTIVFHDLLYHTVSAPGEGESTGAAEPALLQMGHGASAVATVRNFLQGSLTSTQNPLDLAINGDGFLQVARPDGSIAFTRDGTLTQSSEGALVTQSGLPIEPEISIPPDAQSIEISQDGVVRVRLPGESVPVEIGQLELARFNNNAGLRSIGGNLYEQTASSGEPIISTPGEEGLGLLRQGFVESSNVEVVQEMVNLITAQRAYEINSKVVTTADQLLAMANQLKR
jgi:flagellar basal-body rod protein FlgG